MVTPISWIVLMTDGLRPDMAETSMPALKSFMEEQGGFRFANSYSSTNWTVSAQVSFFTGLLPVHHGINDITEANRIALWQAKPDYFNPKVPKESLMPIMMKARGYQTSAILANEMSISLYNSIYRYCDQHILTDFIYFRPEKYETYKFKKPFFIYDFCDDGGHSPYGHLPRNSRANYDEYFRTHQLVDDQICRCLPAIYNNDVLMGLAKVQAKLYDEKLAVFFKWFLANNLEKDTAILLLSDHGEGLAEHKWTGHVANLYEELVHNTCYLYHPEFTRGGGLAEKRNIVSSLLDFSPVMLGQDTYGDGINPISSRRTKAFFEFSRKDNPLNESAEERKRLTPPGLERRLMRGLRDGALKYIWTRWLSGEVTDEFFDLRLDPKEENQTPTVSKPCRIALKDSLKEIYSDVT